MEGMRRSIVVLVGLGVAVAAMGLRSASAYPSVHTLQAVRADYVWSATESVGGETRWWVGIDGGGQLQVEGRVDENLGAEALAHIPPAEVVARLGRPDAPPLLLVHRNPGGRHDLLLAGRCLVEKTPRCDSPVRTFRHLGRTVAVLDASGSVNDALPEILGILSGLRREITSVFLFSNQVVEVPFERLLAGKLQTTWGTDFDPPRRTRSILERGFQKAVIATDGYASLQPDLLAQLKQKHFQALSVLFGDSPNGAALAPLGTIVHLEDICS